MEPAPPPYEVACEQPYEVAFSSNNAVTSQPGKYNYGVDYPTDYLPSEHSTFHQPQSIRVLNDLEKAYVRLGDRLIFDFEKSACCPGQYTGLDMQAKQYVPTELAAVGITSQLWGEWMSELDLVQEKAPTITGCMLLFCFPGGLVQCILCASFCPISGNHALKCLPCCYGDYHDGLRQWQIKVNKELNSHSMHAKLLTYKPFNHAPRSKYYGSRISGKDHNYEMSFLAIAVTNNESLKLQSESWDHGVNDKCTSGIGRCL